MRVPTTTCLAMTSSEDQHKRLSYDLLQNNGLCCRLSHASQQPGLLLNVFAADSGQHERLSTRRPL